MVKEMDNVVLHFISVTCYAYKRPEEDVLVIPIGCLNNLKDFIPSDIQ